MKKWHILISLSICLGLCSCMSVPLSTMVRMRGFGPKHFAALDPNEIRLKIQTPANIAIRVEKTVFSIAVSITDPVQEQTAYRFPMELVRRQHETTGWIYKEQKINYILRMTPQGISDFVKLQEKIQQRVGFGHGSITVSAYTDFYEKEKVSTPPSTIKLSIFLKLGKDEDFMTLIDDAALPFEPSKDGEPNQVRQK
jgi:hypothetical protein